MPSGRFEKVNAMVASVPPQVVGSVIVPKVMVGIAGSFNVAFIFPVEVQPDAVMVMLL